jgi:hypothetical protein
MMKHQQESELEIIPPKIYLLSLGVCVLLIRSLQVTPIMLIIECGTSN